MHLTRLSSLLFVAFIFVACASAGGAPVKGPLPAGASWEGTFDTDFGQLSLKSEGESSVSGGYSYTDAQGQHTGTVKGTFDGNQLSLDWDQPGLGTGKALFTMHNDGTAFSGSWGHGESHTDGGAWNGKKM